MREIGVNELEDAMQRGTTVVDVREPVEFAQAHVPGAGCRPGPDGAADVTDG